MQNKFSIIIPTWNNLDYLKLCIASIRKNSTYKHQIIVHINDGGDGTLDWVRQQNDIEYRHSETNVGICWALNGMRPLVKTEYILYLNDDMYVLPQWDLELWAEIEAIGHNQFFISSTMIQPRPFYCKSVIAPANYGENTKEFREEDLLREYMTLQHHDWLGGTWPPNVVHRDMWDMVGGYSIEFSPGMYSDPDFSAKLYMAGVRIFKGISASRVYHFEARSTGRVKKNKGSRQFLNKWGITSGSFMRIILRRGDIWTDEVKIDQKGLKNNAIRSKIKRILTSFKGTGHSESIVDNLQ